MPFTELGNTGRSTGDKNQEIKDTLSLEIVFLDI